MRSALIGLAALMVPALAAAQDLPPMSDEEVVKLASSAAPPGIGDGATIVAIDYDGMQRVVRDGTNGWTCFPGHRFDNRDPLCADKNGREWLAAWMGGERPPPGKLGVIYMLHGTEGLSSTDPGAMTETPTNNWIKIGPHLMLVGTGADALAGYPEERPPDPSKPFVMWPNTRFQHVVLPVATK